MKMLMVRMTDRVSGAEVYNLNLLQGFAGYPDIKISFLTNSEYFIERIKERGGEAFYFSSNIEEIGTKRNFLKALIYSPFLINSFISTIKKIEKEEKFNLICLQSMTEKIFITPILKLLNYKIVWVEHGPLYKTQRAKVIKVLYRLISNFVDKIIAVSKDTEKDLINGGVNKNKIKTLYIGVDTKYFAPLSKTVTENEKKKLKVPLKNYMVGFLGTVNKEKGIEDFVEVARELNKIDSNISYLIIGDGPLLKEIKEKNNNKNFIFTGFQSDVKKHIGILDLLFFPTKHNEGMSLSILETMSMGKVVVARDIGGNSEIINTTNGYLYKHNEGISDFIFSLLKNRKKLRDVGKNARDEIIQNFDINKSVKNFYDSFLNI